MSNSSKPKVLIIGSGALGLVAAYTLEFNKQAEVTIVVRSQYEKASTDGYNFKSVIFGNFDNWKPTKVVKSVQEANEYAHHDFILVSLKNLPDAPKTVEQIIHDAVIYNPKSAIVLLQNGIDIEKPIIKQFPGHVIISGVSLIGCTNLECVVNQMTIDSVQFGLFENNTVKDKQAAEDRLQQWLKLYTLSKDKNAVTLDTNVRLTRWKKLVYNSATNYERDL
ncbi:unnamed protein product [Ambrosiozyma monospora]|uniref:Unnamed protein product n=1 Tax=Ambrosiozyma monospora TaxID=43982 RepID=A0ACB5TT70_AMBMO|nr:unnamed protein product [Ambrosiozyma monospora]